MKSIYDFKKISSIFLLTVVLAFAACSKDATDTGTQSSSDDVSETKSSSEGFESAYKAANDLRLQAAELEYEWRDTEKFLLEAKNAYANGNKDTAMQLLNKAHQQAELAIAQAQAEATAWTSSVPK